MTYLRGNVYFVQTEFGDKPFLVVSNNARNRGLGNALSARITTTKKTSRSTIIELTHNDPVVGRVICDDIEVIYDDEPYRHAGALSHQTMLSVNQGLKNAFSLP